MHSTKTLPGLLVFSLATLFLSSNSWAFNILDPADPIIAIDLDFTTGSNSPGGEVADFVLDGDSATKYLNFGTTNTGFIVTPSAPTAVQSFIMTTANDFPVRDPATWVLYGTNDPITTEAHGTGRVENWTQIAMGDVALPEERFTAGDPVGFTNNTAFSSYKMLIPSVKDDENGCCMQVADVGFYTTMDGTGANVLSVNDPIVPIRDVDPTPSSNSPENELAIYAIDRNINTKYLNFGEERSGFIVTPSNSAPITSFTITTANDAIERDPTSWELYGTNDTIVTEENGIGDAENWTLIDSGTVNLPTERLAEGPEVAVNNTSTVYDSYRMIFPSVRDAVAANSMQIAEISLNSPDLATLVVNRQTGEIEIRAEENISIGSYELLSPTFEGLDSDAWNSIASTGADADDTWAETSATSGSLAEEDEAGGADNGFALSAGNSYSLGSLWNLPSAFEDLVFQLRDEGGLAISEAIEFVGSEIPVGDYSRNGVVGPEDWDVFRAGYGGNYAGLSLAEAYLNGDLDGDLDSDIDDFNLFVESAGGLQAILGSQAVPEPSSWALLAALTVMGLAARFRFSKRMFAYVASVTIALMLAANATAQSFTNVGFAPVGISMPEGQMNEDDLPENGPQNLFDDDFLDDDPTVINEELFILDYNDPDLVCETCEQYQGMGAAPKTVFFDYGSPVNANWFAYSQRSGADPTADRVGKFEFWFSNTDFGDVVPATEPDAVFELLPTDSRLQDSALRPYTLSGEHSGRYVAMRLTVSELSADQPVNNIGGHEFRLLSGPGDVVAEVNRATGEIVLSNNQPGAQSIELKSLTIESPLGGLDESGFDGLGGSSAAFPEGNGSGNGWEIGGGSNPGRLAEGYFSGESTLAPGTTGLSLGNAYNELSLTEDLVVRWSNSEGNIFDARVTYVDTAPDILVGDYNNDSVVDAADYTVWRDALGTDASLPTDPTPGVVDHYDYLRWKNSYEQAAAGGLAAGVAAVPEPATAAIASVAIAAVAGIAWRKRKL